jgi:hypothetical protein
VKEGGGTCGGGEGGGAAPDRIFGLAGLPSPVLKVSLAGAASTFLLLGDTPSIMVRPALESARGTILCSRLSSSTGLRFKNKLYLTFSQ